MPRRTDILTCSSFNGVEPALGIHSCSLSHKDDVDRRPQAGLVAHVTLPLLFVGSCKELMWSLGCCPEKGNGMVLSLFVLYKV